MVLDVSNCSFKGLNVYPLATSAQQMGSAFDKLKKGT